MRFVAIVGAGELGASIARTLANRGRIAEIRLIDEASDVARGKALDIQQAAPIENSPTRVIASSDVTAAVGAAAVLLADRVPSTVSGQTGPTSSKEAPAAAATGTDAASGAGRWGPASDAARRGAGGPANHTRTSSEWGWGPASTYEWSGETGLALVRRLAGIDRSAIIVCTGGTQHDLLVQGLYELGLPRTRFFGSAPEAVASALRALVALEADVSPSAVALAVLGRVPYRVVVPWSDATIAGRPLARVLSASQLARIERRAAAVGYPGPYALASAAARLGEMLVAGSRRIVCCTVGLDGEFGMRRASSAVPVLVGQSGIARVIAPLLDPREQTLLENVLVSRQ
jgi:malate/lactate dehydrogenase